MNLNATFFAQMVVFFILWWLLPNSFGRRW